MTVSGAARWTDADVPRFLAGSASPASSTSTCTSCPRTCCARSGRTSTGPRSTTGRPGRCTTGCPRPERVATLRAARRPTFAPLVYPHRPGMARWLTEWVTDFAAATPARCPPPRSTPSRTSPTTSARRVEAGARVVKVHVQVGGFDPRDPLLRPAWGLLADAGVPAVVHCGNGPLPWRVHRPRRLRRGPRRAPAAAGGARARRDARLRAALDLWPRHPDCTSTRRWSAPPFTEAFAPLPPDWAARLADVARPRRVRLRLPEHPLRLRRAGAGRRGAGRPPTTGSAPPFLRSVLHDAPGRLLGRVGSAPQQVHVVALDLRITGDEREALAPWPGDEHPVEGSRCRRGRRPAATACSKAIGSCRKPLRAIPSGRGPGPRSLPMRPLDPDLPDAWQR